MNPSINPDQKPLLEYDGKIGELYGIFLKNFFLAIVTLGIYRFWGITNIRKYVWSHMRFQGERFEYTGKGGELFLGVLMAWGILFGSLIVLMIIGSILGRILGNSHVIAAILKFVWLFFFYIAALGAYYSAERYRLSRTLWCSIRGGMSGSLFGAPLKFGAIFFLYLLITVLTIFQLIPWMTVRLSERLINASSFGTEQFRFKGSASRLYGMFLASFFGSAALLGALAFAFYGLMQMGVVPLPEAYMFSDTSTSASISDALPFILCICALIVVYILGATLIRCAYYALVARHIAGNTTLGSQLHFGSTITGRNLFGLILGNMAITIFTLGFGYPIALQRSLKLTARTLKVTGTIDPATLAQNEQSKPFTGDGALNVLDGGGML